MVGGPRIATGSREAVGCQQSKAVAQVPSTHRPPQPEGARLRNGAKPHLPGQAIVLTASF